MFESEHEWYACDFPERPHDPEFTAYWSECRACMFALAAAKMQSDPDRGLDLRSPIDPQGKFPWTLGEVQPFDLLPMS